MSIEHLFLYKPLVAAIGLAGSGLAVHLSASPFCCGPLSYDVDMSSPLQHSIVGKRGDLDACEDTLLVTEYFAAIIDGATDKSGVDFGGHSGGRVVSSAIADALETCDPEASLPEAVEHINEFINQVLAGHDFTPQDRPCASMVCYSRARCEVWSVGDQHYSVGGIQRIGTKQVDQITASARSMMLMALQAKGETFEGDPGRELIMPLLKIQSVFANHPSSPMGYGVLNGLAVPGHLLEITPASHGQAVVLASDGYISPAASLLQAEQELAHVLKVDPLCINENMSTKGLAEGQVSYDDRSYVAFTAGDDLPSLREPASVTKA